MAEAITNLLAAPFELSRVKLSCNWMAACGDRDPEPEAMYDSDMRVYVGKGNPTVERNIATMKRQLQSMGLALDWSREIATCDPSYYMHEQAMFIDFMKAGPVERKV